MSSKEFDNLPDPKFKQGQYITDGEEQSFEISFVEWDFEKEEYYYFPIPDTYAGKIYESEAKLTVPPKDPAMEAYELLFGDKPEREADE